MWNDEDNNPYGSFDRRDSTSSPPADPVSPSAQDHRPSTPTSTNSSPNNEPPEFISRPQASSDAEDDEDYPGTRSSQGPPRKKGGYNSRIEQILYENPELPIIITDAGKNHESGGNHIVYTIRTGDLEVRRRYSEFSSLRATLVNLHPTLIIPPIPEKHSMADYAAKPTKAKEDAGIIDLRKRMLGVFLNRCRRMKDVREDGVWWRFLDPNASWSEVLHAHPVASIPKSNMKAPPLDPANPTPAHSYLPIPSSSAKLKSLNGSAGSGTPTSPPAYATSISAAAHTIPGPQIFGRFPPASQHLSEQDLDPYFVNFESATRELELLLQGNVEKVNRRTLTHLSTLSADLAELGARYNAFSLSEQSPSLAAAIEKIGQSVDSSYIATEELSSSLGAGFAEPMRESAQFAGVVRSVLRFRVLKRVQEDLTKQELTRKQALLSSLERSEAEAKRIDQYLSSSTAPGNTPKRSASARSSGGEASRRRETGNEETASIDSDFPPTHGDAPSSPPSAAQGAPENGAGSDATFPRRSKSQSGSFVANKIFGRISHAMHGIVDVDPERTRRDQIGKTRESLGQLEQALGVAEQDVKDASAGVLKDLKRFQKEKEDDLKRYMIAYAKCHIDWAKKNLDSWEEAKGEVGKIELPVITSSSKKRRLDQGGATKKNPHQPIPISSNPSQSFPQSPRLSPSLESAKKASSATSSSTLLPAQVQSFLSDASRASISRPSQEPSTAASSPSAAYAGLSLDANGSGEMTPSDDRIEPSAAPDGPQLEQPVPSSSALRTVSNAAEQNVLPDRSSSPAIKRTASELEGSNGSIEVGEDARRYDSSSAIMNGSRSAAATSNHIHADDEVMDTRSPTSSPSAEEAPQPRASAAQAGHTDSMSYGLDGTGIMPAAAISAANGAGSSNSPNSNSDDGVLLPSGSDRANCTPSIDDQIAKVTSVSAQPLQKGQKGFVVASRWLERVKARASGGKDGSPSKASHDGEVGPVDNSSLVEVSGSASENLQDEKGDPFIAMKPGLMMGEDYEILPTEAWELVLRWYGIMDSSPVIVRYVQNTSPDGMENLQYETYPPLYTISKLRNDSQSMDLQSMREGDSPSVKIIASRSQPFNKFLKQVKSLAGIEMQNKIRVWRILGPIEVASRSSATTPAPSRGVSPAPPAACAPFPDTQKKLVLDLNTFFSLEEGSQREVVEVQDQTMNEKYNGHMTMSMAGLAQDATLVLEERIGGPGGGEWISEAARSSAAAKGLSVSSRMNGITQNVTKARSAPDSGRSSPAPASIMTRARSQKTGRTLGTCGLSNLGNTCYMNSALQCVRGVEELTQYFRLGRYRNELNPSNPLSHNGDVARAYGSLLESMYSPSSPASVAPRNFKNTIGRYGPSFSGYGQQDSQEFLGFLLDGLQEDLNRIHKKPYLEKPDSTDEMVHDPVALRGLADRCWEIYKARNDSVIADLFAGTYKSTLVCPVCEKVSITFDPFNNLTLQLPIENVWSKDVYFFGLRNRPVRISVEVDKNATVKTLKEFVSKRLQDIPIERLQAAEIYKSKFYRVYDDNSPASEVMQPNDDVGIYELEAAPTNYPPPAPKQAMARPSIYFNQIQSVDEQSLSDPRSPFTVRLLVPVFSRLLRDSSSRFPHHQIFAVPFYMVLTRDETYDYEALLKKVLRHINTLTTREIAWDEGPAASASPEDEDMVVTTSEDADSTAGTKTKPEGSEGEDGFVDVSMKDATDGRSTSRTKGQPSQRHPLLPSTSIPPEMQNMFVMRTFAHSGEFVPTGWTSRLEENSDFPTIISRLDMTPPDTPRIGSPSERPSMPGDKSSSSDDEYEDVPQHSDVSFRAPDQDSDSDSDPVATMQRVVSRPPSRPGKTKAIAREEAQPAPLVRLTEGIILDWTVESHDALFGGNGSEDEMRGMGTWENIEILPDDELKKKRALRANRRKKGVSLGDCLDEFGKEEVLSENDAWYCPRCKAFRRATKKFELWKCPDILVIHLKRFSANRGFRDKIDVVVDFPIEGLDLSERVALVEEGKSTTYDLFAVDNHYGGLGGGHYTACAKNFVDGEWYDYNDTMVTRKSPQSAITSAAYLLFYRRRSDHALGGPIFHEILDEINREDSGNSSPHSSSPVGDGRRLGDSSHSGSSSVSRGLSGPVARAQQGHGGLVGGDLTNDDDDDEDDPPAYSNDLLRVEHGRYAPTDTMQVDEGIEPDVGIGPFNDQPTWGFSGTHLGPDPAVGRDDDREVSDDDDDALSDQAANGSIRSSACMTDLDDRMAEFHDVDEGIDEPPDPGSDDHLVRHSMDDDDDEDEVADLRLRRQAPNLPSPESDVPVIKIAAAEGKWSDSAARLHPDVGFETDEPVDGPVAEVFVEEGEGLGR
ncbi:MAG: CSN-associated deubiquitinating enzyme Ubp12 [Caeruleum heppii]|nr:MAG: CSN-associated deubiquitinating enzyme Ubp12 [Caeruleum heppii]